jgi:hypothetical protein
VAVDRNLIRATARRQPEEPDSGPDTDGSAKDVANDVSVGHLPPHLHEEDKVLLEVVEMSHHVGQLSLRVDAETRLEADEVEELTRQLQADQRRLIANWIARQSNLGT